MGLDKERTHFSSGIFQASISISYKPIMTLKDYLDKRIKIKQKEYLAFCEKKRIFADVLFRNIIFTLNTT